MSKKINSREAEGATDLEKRALREEYTEIVLSKGTNSAGKIFHIPTEDEGTEIKCRSKKCRKPSKNSNQHYQDWKRKPLSAYPKGWRPWCKMCVEVWRNE
jgi:hypothetical protein